MSGRFINYFASIFLFNYQRLIIMVVQIDPIKKEINRLSLEIALLRYDAKENIQKGIPIGFWKEIGGKIAILQEQKLNLELGKVSALHPHYRHLFK